MHLGEASLAPPSFTRPDVHSKPPGSARQPPSCLLTPCLQTAQSHIVWASFLLGFVIHLLPTLDALWLRERCLNGITRGLS